MLTRRILLGDDTLPDCAELVRRGRERASSVQVVPGAFLTHYDVASEAEYKRQAMTGCRIMQHAQIGFREFEKSRRAWAEIYEVCARENVRVDRYGVCLDWSMGLPRDRRKAVSAGTGLILEGPEDFARLASAAPVAPHFGDFVMGLPAAVENTEAALLAGATAIGNLGQYFTFRLPHWDDDAATTAATVEALALVAAQDQRGRRFRRAVHRPCHGDRARCGGEIHRRRPAGRPDVALLGSPFLRPLSAARLPSGARPRLRHARHHDLRQHHQLSRQRRRKPRQPCKLHSVAFWNEVDKVLPSWRMRKDWLRRCEYGASAP
jgi:hypothetical protein